MTTPSLEHLVSFVGVNSPLGFIGAFLVVAGMFMLLCFFGVSWIEANANAQRRADDEGS